MNWFTKQNRGVDKQVLMKTKYWNAVESLVDTDKQTHEKIVQYIYEQVSESMINELNIMAAETEQMTLLQEARNYLAHRVKLLTGYKELAYKKEDKNG